jgi:hypothetical protein
MARGYRIGDVSSLSRCPTYSVPLPYRRRRVKEYRGYIGEVRKRLDALTPWTAWTVRIPAADLKEAREMK